jgi:hypothetical protein
MNHDIATGRTRRNVAQPVDSESSGEEHVMVPVKSPERLDSWKEIARYLDRDERTVQRWETECALPVHRTPGRRRGSVFAYQHELDTWLAGRNETPPASAPVAVAVPSPSTRKPRYIQLGLGLLLLAALLTAGLTRRWQHQSGTALRLSLVENRVIGMDQQGQTVWEYQLRESSLWPPDTSTSWRLIDIAGKPAFVVTASHKSSGGGELDCLSADGRLLWRYEPKMTLKFGSQVDDGPWSVIDFDFANDSPKPKVWASVGDSIWGHSFIAEIDPGTGQSQIRFVNNGGIYAVRSVAGGNRAYLLAGGFNNEYDLPMLAVLDPNQPYAVSPQTPGTRFYCENCGQGSPLKYFILPKSELNQLVVPGPNSVHHIDLLGITLHISTSELSDSMRAIYFFSLTPEISPHSVTLASTYWSEHRRLERERRIKHPAEQCLDYLHPKPIRLWASGKWSELFTEYIPKGGIPEK